MVIIKGGVDVGVCVREADARGVIHEGVDRWAVSGTFRAEVKGISLSNRVMNFLRYCTFPNAPINFELS